MEIIDKVLESARSSGHLNNTIVIYTSDHGEMSMEHRMDFKNNLREPSSRVPLVIAPFNVPGYDAAAGRTVTTLTSHIDILPTLLDIAGVAIPAEVRGQSLLPLLLPGPVPPGRKPFVMSEYHSNLASTGSYMIRQDNYKLITFGHTFPWFNATAYPDQLFDLDADPFEITNVAAAHPDVVARLFSTLEAEMGGTGSIAKVDSQQMARNYQTYKAWYGNFTPAELQKAFLNSYSGVDATSMMALVSRWESAAALLPIQ